jgi:regulator of sirC expression with transglutaminase-like and TPR domain
VRALLDLLRENETAAQNNAHAIYQILQEACKHLEVLDPEAGEEELMSAVASAKAKLRRMAELSEPH